MEVTRVLSLLQFDGNRCRFSNVVFKHSSGPPVDDTPDGKSGISVFANECACPETGPDCICQHVRRFYSRHFPEPCAYWVFDTAILEPTDTYAPRVQSVKVLSDSGDECHYNLHHVPNSRAQKTFERTATDENLYLCHDGQMVPFDCGVASQLKPIAENLAYRAQSLRANPPTENA